MEARFPATLRKPSEAFAASLKLYQDTGELLLLASIEREKAAKLVRLTRILIEAPIIQEIFARTLHPTKIIVIALKLSTRP